MGNKGGESKSSVYLSDEGFDISKKLCELAMMEPEAFVDRARKLASWSSQDNSLVPISHYSA